MNVRMRFAYAVSLCTMIGLFLQMLSGDWMVKGRNKARRDLNIQHNGIIHVISPFKVSNCEEPFCPFDQEQSVAIESMIRAKAKAGVPVTLAAATFPEDMDIIPSDFMTLPPLLRDTKSAYPHIPSMKKLPFIQDIFDRVLEASSPFDYVIYTNSDIILDEEFYNIVESKIQEGYDAFSINRQTMSKTRKIDNIDVPYTALDLDEIFKLRGKRHPGFDCFVMRKDILSRIRMADVFLGSPPFANVLVMQLRHATNNFYRFQTRGLKATYHLGNDKNWVGKKTKEIAKQNVKNAFCGLPEVMNKCINAADGFIHRKCHNLLDVIRYNWGFRITYEERELCTMNGNSSLTS